jgi:hypothetical protein
MSPALARMRLRLELLASRYGAATFLLAAAALAICGWMLWRQHDQLVRITAQQARVEMLEAQARKAVFVEAVPSYVWSSVLERQAAPGDEIKALFKSAKAHRLTVAEADYRRSLDRIGLLEGQQIVIPLTGTYPDLRRWIEHVLKTMPHASIDKLSVQRETMADKTVQARVQLTLWQRTASVTRDGASVAKSGGP